MRERLILTLAAAGVPVDTVTGDGPGVVVTYQAWATEAQRAAGAAVVAAFDWSQAAHDLWLRDRRRLAASALLDALGGESALVRAVVLVLVDDVNDLRQWVTSFKAAVAAATTLADLKTRVAALANTPDRTAAQARAAVANRITGGGADS